MKQWFTDPDGELSSHSCPQCSWPCRLLHRDDPARVRWDVRVAESNSKCSLDRKKDFPIIHALCTNALSIWQSLIHNINIFNFLYRNTVLKKWRVFNTENWQGDYLRLHLSNNRMPQMLMGEKRWGASIMLSESCIFKTTGAGELCEDRDLFGLYPWSYPSVIKCFPQWLRDCILVPRQDQSSVRWLVPLFG